LPFVDITGDGQTIAVEDSIEVPADKSWWAGFMEWIGIREDSSGDSVVLKSFPSGQDIIGLKGCSWPHFSPDDKTLVVRGKDGSVQLWDLPIRKPIGKILGLAGLAALATLLAFNGIGWLRRRNNSMPPASSENDELVRMEQGKGGHA
jgi:WD40 repeat protein